MAVIGSAHVIVRAITTGFDNDVKKAFRNFSNEALNARKSFQTMVRTGYLVGPLVSQLVSSIGALVGGLVSLGAAVLGAVPSLVSLLGVFTSLGLAAGVTMAAFSGVSAAISAGLKASKKAAADDSASKIAAARRIEDAERRLAEVLESNTENLLQADIRLKEAQLDLNKALEDGREEIQQLGFEAEDAALGEKKASIELEKARETLARVQDLPPNSRARREAQLAFAEAELNLRKAKDRNADLAKEQDKLAGDPKKTQGYVNALKAEQDAVDSKAKAENEAIKRQLDAERELQRAREDAARKNSTGAIDAYQNALENLSPPAREFVNFMVNEFIPALKKLRDAAAAGLFPELIPQLRRLKDELFPVLEPLFFNLAQSVGKAVKSIVDSILDAENISDLKAVFDQAGYVVEGFGKVAGNVYDSFLSIIVGADSQTRRFVDFLTKKTGEFAKFLDTKQASGELDAFFKKTGDIAAQWGSILGNVFSGIVNIVRANFTPGGGAYILLDWFEKATAGFEKFSGSVEGQAKLSEYFKAVSTNAKSILSTLWAFIKVILKAGADPNVKVFWDTLKNAVPSLQSLLTQLNAGGPALANFIVAFMKFLEVTLSTGAIQTFWNVLTSALTTLTNILSDPAMKKFFDAGAKILAFFSAVGIIMQIAGFAFKVVAGAVLQLVAVFEKLKLVFTVVQTGFYALSAATGIAVGPLVAIAAAIAAVVAIIIIAYAKSEIFREAVSNLVSAVGGALKDAFDTIKGALMEFKPEVEKVGNVLKGLGDFIGKYIVPIFQFAFVGAIKVAAEMIALAIRLVKGLWEILTGNPIEGLKTIFGALGKFIINSITGIWNAAKDALGKIPVFNSILKAAESVFGVIARLWNSTFAKIKFTVPDWVPGLGGKGFAIPSIPGFAEGGIIQPQLGGSIVRVAEAGRPERIEPLDPQGLSRRDRAIIAELSGGRGSGNVINVYPSPGMNESELAAMIDRTLAFRLRRGGA